MDKKLVQEIVCDNFLFYSFSILQSIANYLKGVKVGGALVWGNIVLVFLYFYAFCLIVTNNKKR